jgi:CheY-like chemotaxis protein
MSETEPRLLMLIDDEPAQSRLIAALAAREGWRTLVVHDAETAIATLGTRQGCSWARSFWTSGCPVTMPAN